MHETLLEIRHMHKAFGPTIALKDVDLTLRRGEVRGLVGENGSGKSTIMSIAAGMQSATSGQMLFKGQEWKPSSMIEAQRAGISMILQEANTIPGVTVAQNLFAGREEEFSTLGILNRRKMTAAGERVLREFGISHIHAQDRIDSYGFEDRKLVELARCVGPDTELLVVDETTTALSQEGRDILYRLMRRMADQGKSVVFISHDIDEIIDKCDIVTVLRDGEIIGDLTRAELTAADGPRRIRFMMVGREIGEKYYRDDYDPSCTDESALEIEHISCGPIHDFSLVLHRGEIVGIGGLSGCGMHEVGRAAYGLEKLSSGRVLCRGKEISSPLQAIESGIGYISKNRDSEALILQGAIGDNIVLPSIPALSRLTLIRPAKERAVSEAQISALRIKCSGGKQWVSTLSGGNKQKVSFAKWLAKGSDVLIMDCPTRGVDVGVKQAMYALMEDMKRQGKAILMISEELAELIGMADRILIMKDFAVAKEFVRHPELKETDMIEYMV